jgi:hypothetical protein
MWLQSRKVWSLKSIAYVCTVMHHFVVGSFLRNVSLGDVIV